MHEQLEQLGWGWGRARLLLLMALCGFTFRALYVREAARIWCPARRGCRLYKLELLGS